MAVKPEIQAITDQLETALLEALDTVAHITQRNRYMEATIKARTEKILAVLAAPYEDPALTVVGDIVTGPTTEQPFKPNP